MHDLCNVSEVEHVTSEGTTAMIANHMIVPNVDIILAKALKRKLLMAKHAALEAPQPHNLSRTDRSNMSPRAGPCLPRVDGIAPGDTHDQSNHQR